MAERKRTQFCAYGVDAQGKRHALGPISSMLVAAEKALTNHKRMAALYPKLYEAYPSYTIQRRTQTTITTEWEPVME